MTQSCIWRPDEFASGRLRELYRRHGYMPYRMSKFESYDLYVRNKRFLLSDNILTFTDTNGQLMALKPDVTLSIIKNTRDPAEGLQKVYYNEHVYRAAPGSGYREIMQTGLECIGRLDTLAIGEVVALAAESLAVIHDNYILDLSHMGFVAGLLEDLEEDASSELLTEISRKNVAAIHAICASRGLPADLAEKASILARLYGTPDEVLPQLSSLSRGQRMDDALAELTQLCRLMASRGLDHHLRLDFSVVNDMGYYNGVIFRGYLPGLASGVLAGGQYDHLLRRMGKTGGAIGFAVYLDQLERLEKDGSQWDVDTLLLYGPGDDPAAVLEQAQALIAQGESVRVERSVPEGLRYRRILSPEKGGAL